jgi:hypothetical protein
MVSPCGILIAIATPSIQSAGRAVSITVPGNVNSLDHKLLAIRPDFTEPSAQLESDPESRAIRFFNSDVVSSVRFNVGQRSNFFSAHGARNAVLRSLAVF